MTEKLSDYLPTSPDVQAERLAELKRLFPDLFDGEGQLKLDEVKQLVGDEQPSQERYDFSWYGKRKAKETAYTPTTATLSYDESRSVNPEKADGNLIIEGENLETLKTLLSAYREKVKCIYIDPPYNTGKDFVYSDNYTEDKRAYWEETGGLEKGVKVDTNPETTGRYHSNWLSMMYSRLLLARQLLKDDGVIFVSIDDNEVHNLRRLMDDVFGEENFVVELVWEKKVSPSNDSQFFSNDHEYIIVYAKEKNAGVISRLERTSEHNKYYKNPDNDSRGIWNSTAATCNKSHLERPNLYYSITNPNTNVEIFPSKSAVWATSKEKMIELLKDNRIYWGKDGTSMSPRIKIFLTEAGKVVPRSVLKYKDVGHTQSATKECKNILSEINFDYPKPSTLIAHIIKLSCDKQDILLDFFSGSGTTAQAVAELNAEDKGNRKFILVQLPEQTPKKSEARKAGYNKISDITIERVKRVIEGYGEDPKPLETGFKVYQLTKSHFPRTEFKPDPEKSEDENIEILKAYIKEKEQQLTGLFEPSDIQDEVLLKNGFKLNYQFKDVSEFSHNKVMLADDGENKALLCLDQKLEPETVKCLIKKPQAFICLERSLTTDDKWNLREHLKHEFVAF